MVASVYTNLEHSACNLALVALLLTVSMSSHVYDGCAVHVGKSKLLHDALDSYRQTKIKIENNQDGPK